MSRREGFLCSFLSSNKYSPAPNENLETLAGGEDRSETPVEETLGVNNNNNIDPHPQSESLEQGPLHRPDSPEEGPLTKSNSLEAEPPVNKKQNLRLRFWRRDYEKLNNATKCGEYTSADEYHDDEPHTYSDTCNSSATQSPTWSLEATGSTTDPEPILNPYPVMPRNKEQNKNKNRRQSLAGLEDRYKPLTKSRSISLLEGLPPLQYFRKSRDYSNMQASAQASSNWSGDPEYIKSVRRDTLKTRQKASGSGESDQLTAFIDETIRPGSVEEF